MNLYSVKDNVSGQFYPPEMYDRDELIIRIYKNYVNNGDSKSLIVTNSSDFTIYKVGEFDYQKTGKITPCDAEFICNLSDLKEARYGESGSN